MLGIPADAKVARAALSAAGLMVDPCHDPICIPDQTASESWIPEVSNPSMVSFNTAPGANAAVLFQFTDRR